MTVVTGPSIHQGDHQFLGTLSVAGINLPSGGLRGTHFSSSASDRLTADQVVHQFTRGIAQEDSANAANSTQIVHIAKGAGVVSAVRLVVGTLADQDYVVNVDIKRSNAGAAFATLLAASLNANNTSTVRVPVSGTLIGDPSYNAGDVFQLTINSVGTTGSPAKGVCAEVFFQEKPS